MPRPERTRRWATASLLAAALGAAGFTAYLLWPPYHFAVVETGVLYRSGQLGARSLARVHELTGFRTLVDLVGEKRDKREVQDEREFAEKNGVRYVHLPLPPAAVGIEPYVERFLEIVDDPRNRPVLIHCWQGIKRTGVMVAVFRMEYQRIDSQKALEGLTAFGRDAEDFKETERDFIAGYIPRWRREPSSGAPTADRPGDPAGPPPGPAALPHPGSAPAAPPARIAEPPGLPRAGNH